MNTVKLGSRNVPKPGLDVQMSSHILACSPLAQNICSNVRVLQWLHLFRIKRIAQYNPNEAAKKKLPTMNLTSNSK